jgi:hypothetical protein
VLFATVLGFLVAAACGYMAGLVDPPAARFRDRDPGDDRGEPAGAADVRGGRWVDG